MLEIYTQKDQQEIKNLIEAYSLLGKIEPTGSAFILSEEIIRELHAIITNNVPDENNIPGEYRNGLVNVGDKVHGGVYTPPRIKKDVENLMRVFVEWINSPEIIGSDPFIRAALAHYYFYIISLLEDSLSEIIIDLKGKIKT